MVRTYTDNLAELFDSGLVEIIKVKVFSSKYGEDDEIQVKDFLESFKTLTQSVIFSESVQWAFEIVPTDISPECDLYIEGDIDGDEEVLLYVRLNKTADSKATEKDATDILLKWFKDECNK